MTTVHLISTFENYKNEESGDKANTVRQNLTTARYNKIMESTHVCIHRGYTNKSFIRKISNKTYWSGIMIISWRHE